MLAGSRVTVRRFGCTPVRGTAAMGAGIGGVGRECRGRTSSLARAVAGRRRILAPSYVASAVRTNLCGRMTGTAVYEIRRARTREELAAALALRHDVFCVEQGVPERDELDGRDHEGIHLVAVRDGELLATCRIVLVGSTAQFSRLAVRRSARRQGIATALLGARRRGVAAGRGAADRAPRPDLRSRAIRAGRLPPARPGLLGGGDRAHRDGEAPRLSVPCRFA